MGGFPAEGNSAWGWPGIQTSREAFANWQGGKNGNSSNSASGWTNQSGSNPFFQQGGRSCAASGFNNPQPSKYNGKGGSQGNPFASQQSGKGGAQGNSFGGQQAGYSGRPVKGAGFVGGKGTVSNPFQDQNGPACKGFVAYQHAQELYQQKGHPPPAGIPFGAGANFQNGSHDARAGDL